MADPLHSKPTVQERCYAISILTTGNPRQKPLPSTSTRLPKIRIMNAKLSSRITSTPRTPTIQLQTRPARASREAMSTIRMIPSQNQEAQNAPSSILNSINLYNRANLRPSTTSKTSLPSRKSTVQSGRPNITLSKASNDSRSTIKSDKSNSTTSTKSQSISQRGSTPSDISKAFQQKPLFAAIPSVAEVKKITAEEISAAAMKSSLNRNGLQMRKDEDALVEIMNPNSKPPFWMTPKPFITFPPAKESEGTSKHSVISEEPSTSTIATNRPTRSPPRARDLPESPPTLRDRPGSPQEQKKDDKLKRGERRTKVQQPYQPSPLSKVENAFTPEVEIKKSNIKEMGDKISLFARATVASAAKNSLKTAMIGISRPAKPTSNPKAIAAIPEPTVITRPNEQSAQGPSSSQGQAKKNLFSRQHHKTTTSKSSTSLSTPIKRSNDGASTTPTSPSHPRVRYRIEHNSDGTIKKSLPVVSKIPTGPSIPVKRSNAATSTIPISPTISVKRSITDTSGIPSSQSPSIKRPSTAVSPIPTIPSTHINKTSAPASKPTIDPLTTIKKIGAVETETSNDMETLKISNPSDTDDYGFPKQPQAKDSSEKSKSRGFLHRGQNLTGIVKSSSKDHLQEPKTKMRTRLTKAFGPSSRNQQALQRNLGEVMRSCKTYNELAMERAESDPHTAFRFSSQSRKMSEVVYLHVKALEAYKLQLQEVEIAHATTKAALEAQKEAEEMLKVLENEMNKTGRSVMGLRG